MGKRDTKAQYKNRGDDESDDNSDTEREYFSPNTVKRP
jgi:hypothetical protein